MDFFQDSNTKTVYDKSKYEVKKWENQFKKSHGRPPSKLDIREASKEVRNAYKLYFRLKTAALEESLMDIEGFNGEVEHQNTLSTVQPKKLSPVKPADEATDISSNVNTSKTWGLHLNKQLNKQEEKERNFEKVSVNLSFTQKLFENSKSKKLPRKSLSFTRKKSEADSKPQFLSQPDSSTFTESCDLNVGCLTIKTTSSITTASQPINLLQNISNNANFKKIRDIDPEWVQRTNNLLHNKHYNNSDMQAFSDDDIIGNSEDDLDDSCSVAQIAKKQRTISTSPVDQTGQKELLTIDISPKRLDFSNLFASQNLNKSESNTIVNNIILNKCENTKNDNTHNVNKKSDEELNVVTKNKVQEKKQKKSIQERSTKTTSNVNETSLRKSTRKRKSLGKNVVLSDTENEDPFHSDNDDNDANFQPTEAECDISEKTNSNSNLQKKTKVKKAKSSSSKTEQVEDKKENESYELEYSVKPRVVTVPRIKNLKQVVRSKKKLQTEDGDKQVTLTSAEEKLRKKVESGSANDNYVPINLKKKIYARGKSKTTFSKYKKQMWKQKNSFYGSNVDMRGCDGGTFTCFNCGQAGHFARNCTMAKSDKLLPLENDEICPHPTLEEAQKMATESVLAIRTPSHSMVDVTPVKDTEDKFDSEHFNDELDDELLALTENLERELRKIDVQNYLDSTTYVKPYYNLKESGNVIDIPDEVYSALKLFGHNNFRTGQELAVMRILSGKSTLVTLSTGTGKSLCYQLPAYLYSQREPCISLVISPLVSLMEDQVTGIPAFLKAACLHTNQTKVQKAKVLEAIKMGNINILLVSPEAVVAGEKSTGFGSILRQLPPIAFACIDEAHCVSQWSHNFRPSYLKICRVLRERLGVNVILGLTATATRVTSDSIIRHLSIPDGRDGIISDVALPNNLILTISRDVNRDQALLALLLSDRFKECKSIIVYCTRREECQRVAVFLRTCLKNDGFNQENSKKRKRYSLQAEPYHAGMPASRRKSIQKAFMSGELRIVVATVAFGMGINKSDIRAVIHYNMPMSFESYVQEVGRAGRDGEPAHCHLFLDFQGKDQNELSRHIYANSIDRHVIRKLLQHCFVPCSCTSTCPRHEVAFSIQETVQELDIPEENIETLLCYLELHNKRYIEVLSHVYISCKIISYGGPNEIRKAAKDCPPLAMALALNTNKDHKNPNIFEFPVVEVASAMGWDSGICKHKLKNLEWITENNQPKRSRLNVEFSNLGFHLLAPGNLSATALDETLDELFARVQEQERTSILQLHAVHTTLASVSKPTFKMCIVDDDITESVVQLKTEIRKYFEHSNPLDGLPELPTKTIDEEQIKSDTRCLINMYRDNSFTGRAVARIFNGIQSPTYPAFIWGRCKFWRAHLGTDFHAVCQIATREILRMRDL